MSPPGATEAGALVALTETSAAGIAAHRLTVFVSRVTAPFRASALPSRVAPVVTVALVSARMLPLNVLPVPSVADEPTCQVTFGGHVTAPMLANATTEAEPVTSVTGT